MNLLVTGGAGFIGSNVIHHIIDRDEAKKLVNLDCLTYAGHIENLSTVATHPKYAFEIHKGYGTTLHRRRIQKHGPSVLHRKSFMKNFI